MYSNGGIHTMDKLMEELVQNTRDIKKIISNRRREVTIPLIFKDVTTDIKVMFDQIVQLEPESFYEIGLKSLATSYSVPNIDVQNNNFRYSTDKGATFHDINLEIGSYELEDIQISIQNKLRANAHYDIEKDKPYITIQGNPGTGKIEIDIENPDYKIDFSTKNTIGSILGFDKRQIDLGHHVSDGIAMINPLNTILVHCNLVDGTRYNGKAIQSIYEFSPKVPPGYQMVVENTNPTFLPVSNGFGKIQYVRIWLTDEDLRPINLRGEELTIVLLLKQF
jgi:hypothetical protein